MNKKHAYYFGLSALVASVFCDANAAHVYNGWQERYAAHHQQLRPLNQSLEKLVRNMDKLSDEIKELLAQSKKSQNTVPQKPSEQ